MKKEIADKVNIINDPKYDFLNYVLYKSEIDGVEVHKMGIIFQITIKIFGDYQYLYRVTNGFEAYNHTVDTVMEDDIIKAITL